MSREVVKQDKEDLRRALYAACLVASKLVKFKTMSWFGRNHPHKTNIE